MEDLNGGFARCNATIKKWDLGIVGVGVGFCASFNIIKQQIRNLHKTLTNGYMSEQ